MLHWKLFFIFRKWRTRNHIIIQEWAKEKNCFPFVMLMNQSFFLLFFNISDVSPEHRTEPFLRGFEGVIRNFTKFRGKVQNSSYGRDEIINGKIIFSIETEFMIFAQLTKKNRLHKMQLRIFDSILLWCLGHLSKFLNFLLRICSEFFNCHKDRRHQRVRDVVFFLRVMMYQI